MHQLSFFDSATHADVVEPEIQLLTLKVHRKTYQ